MGSLTLDWVQLVTVAGTLQGVVLVGVLFAQRNNRTANRLLAVLMLTFTVFLASSVYYSAGVFQRYPYFFGISYQTPWLFGPLVYLYAVAASDRSWRFAPRRALHFVPVAITLMLTAPIYLMSGPEKIAMYDRIQRGEVPRVIAIIDPTKFVSGIAYSVATLLYLRRHRRRIRNSYSNTEQVNLAWLLWFATAAAVIWVLATSLKIGAVGSRLRDDHVSLAIAVLIYAIGYRGLRQTEIFDYGSSTDDSLRPAAATPEPDTATPRYERSGLTDREAERLEHELLALMEGEKPWKDAELTLADLALRLDSTPHRLSEVLNGQLRQTFYDFVNGYRVREVQRRISSGDGRAFTMLSLALDAGFASKSTFNQSFKNRTGQTPSAYRRRSRRKSRTNTSEPIGSDDAPGGRTQLGPVTQQHATPSTLETNHVSPHNHRHSVIGACVGAQPIDARPNRQECQTPRESALEGMFFPARRLPDAIGLASIRPGSRTRDVLSPSRRRRANGTRAVRALSAAVEDRNS